MKNVVALFLCLSSFQAFAGYECELKLSRAHALEETLAEKKLTIGSNEIKSGGHGTLFVENSKKKKVVTLEINAALSGWENEEDITLVILRKTKKKSSSVEDTISESFTLKRNDEFVGWFDSYKLDIRCEVK